MVITRREAYLIALTLIAIMVLGCEANKELSKSFFLYNVSADDVVKVSLYNGKNSGELIIETEQYSGNPTFEKVLFNENVLLMAARLYGDKLIVCCANLLTPFSTIVVFDVSAGLIKKERSFDVSGMAIVTSYSKEYFTYNADGGLFLVNVGSGIILRISDDVETANLTWSHSGEYLLYIKEDDGGYNLVEYHPSSKEHIKRFKVTVDRPTRMYLSPNDKYLIFKGFNDSDNNDSYDIYVMNMVGGEPWLISTPKPTTLPNLPWSLDSKRVLLGYGGVNYGEGVILYDIIDKKVCYERGIDNFSTIIAWDKTTDDVVVKKEDGTVWKVKLFSDVEVKIYP